MAEQVFGVARLTSRSIPPPRRPGWRRGGEVGRPDSAQLGRDVPEQRPHAAAARRSGRAAAQGDTGTRPHAAR